MNPLKYASFRRPFSLVRLCCFDPVRDWLLLLSFAGVILAAILGWNLWTFSSIAQGEMIGTPAAQAPGFDETILSKAKTIFEKRAAEEAKYEIGEYGYSDPSQ